jgi:orotate phosphoribosyltransferase
MKSVELNIPVNGFFIRKSRKKSGLLNMIEGKINNEKVILVDDIINSGSSFIRQVEVLEKIKDEKQENFGDKNLENIKINSVFSIMRFRDLEYYKYFNEKNIKVESVFELNDITKEAEEKNKNLNIKTKTLEKLKAELEKNKPAPNNFEIK